VLDATSTRVESGGSSLSMWLHMQCRGTVLFPFLVGGGRVGTDPLPPESFELAAQMSSSVTSESAWSLGSDMQLCRLPLGNSFVAKPQLLRLCGVEIGDGNLGHFEASCSMNNDRIGPPRNPGCRKPGLYGGAAGKAGGDLRLLG
jgi:hypothetical protein